MKQASNKTRINSSDVRADTQYAIRKLVLSEAEGTQYGKAGVTLVEMIIAVAIIVIVFTAITPLFRGILNSWDSKAGAAETIQNGRVLIDHLNHNLSKAVRISDVSDSNVTTGYIEFEDNDGNTLRYDIASNYVEFGVVGGLSDLAGPVSTLQFTCYDANDFNTAITDGNDIRLVQVQTTLTNPAPLGQDRTFTAQVYLRTNWETGSGSGLVGWWKLDETSGTNAADSSGYGNDGTLTNMVGDEWTTGQVGGALEFDGGSDYIDTNYLQDGVSKYTISAWVNLASGSTGNNVIVQDRGSGAGNSLTLGIGHGATGRLYFGDDSDSTLIGRYYNGGLNDDTWHHVVGVFDGGGSVTSSQFTVYLDGASVSSGTYDIGSDTAPLTGLGGTQIGHHIGWNSYFGGIIDDVRIYNRALTPEEIAELANVLLYEEFTEAKAGSDTTSITISTPSDTNEGDLLISAVATDGDTSLSLADPGGWTEIDVDDYGTEVTLGAWWKLADDPESATHEFDWTGDEQAYGWMMRFTGHDASGPIDDPATDGETSSTPTSPAVTTTVSDALILRLGAFDDGDITVDDPCLSGHTAITMDKSGSGGGGGCDLEDLSAGTPLTFDVSKVKTPALAQIDATHYLCAYGEIGTAVVLTVDTDAGTVTKGTPFEFFISKGKTPALAQIDECNYLCAYEENNLGHAMVLTVNTVTWEITEGKHCVFDASKGKTPALAKIDSNHYLCAYAEIGTAVVLTVNGGTVTKETPLVFGISKGKTPALAQIDTDNYLLAYDENNLGHAVVLTVDTEDTWEITEAEEEHFVYDDVKGTTPALAQINPTHYLLVYSNTNKHGIAVVLTVNEGTITEGTHYEFDSTAGVTPKLAQIDSTHHLCVYQGGPGWTGWAVVLTVDTDGDYSISEGVSLEYDSAVEAKTPALAQIDECNYLCTYGAGDPGKAVILQFASSGGGGGDVVSGGAGYVKQSAAGDSGTSDFALTESEESQMLTIAIAPDPNSGGEGGGEIRP